MKPIGFMLLTHSKPHQIKRLVTRLNTMFDHPPIVIHHDFGKCPLPDDFLPDNVSFVKDYLETGWGRFSIVEATVLMITHMYNRVDAPDWCVLLSGVCYPIKPAAQILENLTTGNYDAHINGRKVTVDSLTTEWHQKRFDLYCIKYLNLAGKSNIPEDRRLRPKIPLVPLPYFIGRHLLPFSKNFSCYAGSHWFTMNRRTAHYIIDFQQTPMNSTLSNHYKSVYRFPEESYFQTILYNASHLKLQFDNWLYIDWSGPKPPKSLTLADLEKIQTSTAHFARKIDIDSDSDLLGALDRIIDGGDPHQVPRVATLENAT